MFLVLTFIVLAILGTVVALSLKNSPVNLNQFTAQTSILQESIQFLALLAAAAVMARVERRRVPDYNLRGPKPAFHFLSGLVGGFVALSVLIGALYAGGWLKFGPVALSGVGIWEFAVLWAIGFLLTGLSEEGMTRCYMLFTLTRGVNYWWALGTVGTFSLFAFLNTKGSGAGGVYIMTALGILPCLYLHLKKSPSAGFWEASWLTSTFFGYIHTLNKGETTIGIFSAAAIGFIFCVSVRLTGSAWWAIGYHASWDWAQTYFYGTADSGLVAKGHYLTTNPTGAVFWSGGSAGPEGSFLVVPIILLSLLAIVLLYRRKSALRLESASPTAQAQIS
jgi:membrane protease YdiL (CAAX protease family)